LIATVPPILSQIKNEAISEKVTFVEIVFEFKINISGVHCHTMSTPLQIFPSVVFIFLLQLNFSH
jgi:hypothetical protein